MRSARRLSLVLAIVMAVPEQLLAHGVLIGSTPAANSNLVVAPREVRLIFNERPERAFTRMSLTGPDGVVVRLDSLVFGPGNVATARIAGALVPGLYTVQWQTVGRDGHPVSGEFAFSIAPDAAGTVSRATDTAAAVVPGTRPPAAPALRQPDLAPVATILRWLALSSLIAMIGAVAFRYVVIRRLAVGMPDDVAIAYVQPLEQGSARLGLFAVVTLTAVAVVRLLLQRMALGSAADQSGSTLFALLGTSWGTGWLVHVAGAVLALAGFVAGRSGSRANWRLAAAGGVLATVGMAMSGHAIATEGFVVVTVVGHAVHAIAAACWLGTLFVIAAIALPLTFRLQRDDRWKVVADIIQVFSPAALTFAGIAVAAGVLLAWIHLGSIDTLLGSEYGRVLLVKIALVGTTAVAGAYNWLRVRPALGELPGARRLRRSATVELAFAALVLAVTAVLVATPMPVS